MAVNFHPSYHQTLPVIELNPESPWTCPKCGYENAPSALLCNLCGHLLPTSSLSEAVNAPAYRPSRFRQWLYRRHFRLAVAGLSLSMVVATCLLLGWFFISNPPGTETGIALVGGGLVVGVWGGWWLREYW